MDIDADIHGEEGIVFSSMDAHIMQMIIIEHPVIYPFAGSTVRIDSFKFLRASGHRGIEAYVSFRFRIDTMAIVGCGTFFFAKAGVSLATGKRTAPFERMFLFTIPSVYHTQSNTLNNKFLTS